MAQSLYRSLVQWEEGLSAGLGLPDDQVRLVLCCLLQVPLSLLLQFLSPGLKLVYSTLLSCAILLHIFGNYLWLTLALSVVIYALTSALRARAGKPIFAFSMLALSLAHFYRMYTDYGGWKIDITSILMINVGKYSYFSFWYQDQLADSPQTARLPSLPMYLAYMLFLPCNILGPVFTYTEFQNYIYARVQFASIPFALSLKHVGIRLAKFAAFLAVYLVFHTWFFPIGYFERDDILTDPFWYVVLYILLSVDSIKYKYYSVWNLSEAAVCAAGFALEEDGQGFYGNNHCNFMLAEVFPNIKTNIDNWNMSVQRWLKSCLYQRMHPPEKLKASKKLQEAASLQVMMVSAFWHGFYPGYFFSFFLWTVSIFVTKYFFKADTSYPNFYRLYLKSGPVGRLVSVILSKAAINYFGVYFQVLSLTAAIKIAQRSFLIPEAILLAIYATLIMTAGKQRKAPAKSE